MKVGDIYRFRFPAIGWARVLPNPPDVVVTMDDGSPGYLIETLFTKDRWWVRYDGAPNNHRAPWLYVNQQPKGRNMHPDSPGFFGWLPLWILGALSWYYVIDHTINWWWRL